MEGVEIEIETKVTLRPILLRGVGLPEKFEVRALDGHHRYIYIYIYIYILSL